MGKEEEEDKEIIIKKLLHTKESSEDIHYLLEQYKLYVDSHEKVSDRRQKTNEFFLGLNTALLGVLGFLIGNFGEKEFMTLIVILSGIIICYFWYRIIFSYKGLNTGKFAIIHALETKLPAALYDTEWDVLGKGKNKSKYLPFSHIEIKIPWVFVFLYFILLFKFIFRVI